MKKFIKITTRKDESIIRSWIDADLIAQLFQDSVTQAGDNEGSCLFTDGTIVKLIAFNETIDSLN